MKTMEKERMTNDGMMTDRNDASMMERQDQLLNDSIKEYTAQKKMGAGVWSARG
jgi:hypothetical protein